MNTNKLIGQVLLWAGFLCAALASVWRLEIAEHPWQTIPWALYAGSMAVGIVGVVLLRSSAKAAVQHTERVEGEFETLTSSLAMLRSTVAELRGKLDTINPPDIASYIDENCIEPFERRTLAPSRHHGRNRYEPALGGDHERPVRVFGRAACWR